MPLTVASLEAVLDLNKKGFEAGLTGAKKGLSGLASVAAPVGIAIGAIGAGLGATAIAATNTANDIDMALDNIATGLGITGEQAEGYRDTLEGIFTSNFGEDFNDVADAITKTRRAFNDLDGVRPDLEEVAESIFGIRDAFDVDLDSSLDASRVLIKEFGITADEAFDLMTNGMQNIPADDLIDSIREYGNQFGDAGFEADEFFSILQTGTAGGVLGTDKVGDAVKEFSIRALEGGKDIKAAFEALSSPTEDLFGQYQSGAIDTAKAFDLIIARLREQDDLVAQNALGVSFFGTQWEDIGAEALLAVDSQRIGMEEVAGAADTLNQQYDNLGAVIEGFKRRALVAIAPIGDAILELANKAAPFIEDFLDKAVPLMREFGESLGDQLPAFVASASDSLIRIAEVFGLVDDNATGADAAIEILGATLDGIQSFIDSVAAGLANIAQGLENLDKFAQDKLGKGLGEIFGDLGPKAGEGLGGFQIEEGGFVDNLRNFGQSDFVQKPAVDVIAGLFGGGGSQGNNVTVNVNGNINGDQHLQEVVGQSFGQLRTALGN